MKESGNYSRLRISRIVAIVGLIGAVNWLLGPASLCFAQTASPKWSFTGNLNTARNGHTATLLPNGKVLVSGGYGTDYLSSAELYDPAGGVWSNTGNLNAARVLHTATLLQNGKVLVVGGENNSSPGYNPLNSVELYDPSTGSWSRAGNLMTARYGHTATLLPNGKVLVAGGLGCSDGPFGRSCFLLSSAELYDPATDTFSMTGSLPTTPYLSTATLLPNGRVLVAGGQLFQCGSFVCIQVPNNSAELYDPTTGTWTATGNLNTARYYHSATLLPGGKVLVAGFYDDNAQTASNSAELYDPATGVWSNTGNLVEAVGAHTGTLLPNGKVLSAGGFTSDGNPSKPELYDPATGIWTITADLNILRYGHTATLLLTGKVLVAGGSSEYTAELYDSGTSPNQIDDTQFFVRQHYRDFLNREPDPEGLAFWSNEITSCGSDQQCVEVKRINDSASFFLSIEFQESGYLVYRFYKSSFGNLPGAPVPLRFNEFLPDAQQIGQGVIVTQTGWQTVLENNKQAFASDFVQRTRFTTAFPTSMTPDAFVDTLFANAGVTPTVSERAAAINEFGVGTNTTDVTARARALRRVAENSTLAQQEFNRAFVLMQYFGYLRRNPNDAPETTLDFAGYNFWLDKLNSFNGDFTQAEMVKAFLSSTEYRRRFGP